MKGKHTNISSVVKYALATVLFIFATFVSFAQLSHSGTNVNAKICPGDGSSPVRLQFVTLYTGAVQSCNDLPYQISHTWYTSQTGSQTVSSFVINTNCELPNPDGLYISAFDITPIVGQEFIYWVQPRVNNANSGPRIKVSASFTHGSSVTAGITSNLPPNACEGDLVLTATGGSVVNWYRNGNIVSGATGSTYIPTVSGNYKVKVNLSASQCGGNPISPEIPVTITPNVVEIAEDMVNIIQRCGETTVVLQERDGIGLYWQPTNNPSSRRTDFIPGGNERKTKLQLTEPQTIYLRGAKGMCWSQEILALHIQVINPVEGTIIPIDSEACAGASGRLKAVVPAGSTFRWVNEYNQLIGEEEILVTPPLLENSIFYLEVFDPSGLCKSSSEFEVTVTPESHVPPVPLVSKESNTTFRLLLPNPSPEYTYYWQEERDGTSEVHQGTERIVTSPGLYFVRGVKNSTGCWSTYSMVEVYDIQPRLEKTYGALNRIKTTKYELASGVDENNPNHVQVEYSYMDGLGRPVQQVSKQGSPNLQDIVTFQEHDDLGRQPRSYLPYEASTGDGSARPMPFQEQHGFYTEENKKVARSEFPFSYYHFSSLLDRVSSSSAPGEVWVGLAGTVDAKDIAVKNGPNEAGEVLSLFHTFQVGYPLGLISSEEEFPFYYQEGQLYKTITEDEHSKASIEYMDSEGKVVLKKAEAPDGEWAQTYYIYDDFGNLVCILPPEAVKRISQTSSEYFGKSNLEKEAFLQRWAFRYVYDLRKRMIQKQVPGAAAVYMVYDDRDRLVLTQDGVQRPKKEWSFTKYDALNRPIQTGIYTHGSLINQDAMSGLVSSTNFCETYNGSTTNHGYSNAVFPTTNLNILSVTYYDNYNFKSLIGNANYNYQNNELSDQEVAENSFVKGLVTGGKSKVLGLNTTQYLWNVSYYDDKYRPIQTILQNLQTGTDRITSVYNFPGWLLKSKLNHTGNNPTMVLREFVYDHSGRLEEIYHTAGVGERTLISRKEYNEIGELVKNNLHSEDDGTNFMQAVDYRYNIRGWLTHINNSDLSGGDAGDPTDYFGMELGYNSSLETGNSPQFNGNISGVKWSAFLGKEIEEKERAYNYTYDPLNRIKSAEFRKRGVVENVLTWSPSENEYKVDNINYDLNGNIQSLSRKGANATGMDELIYDYGMGTSRSNQLLKVSDTGNEEGFKDGSNTGNDYKYDPNGNMTRDLNKGITSITYNHLNLPDTVSKADGIIKYIYDASGLKLAQEVFPNSGPIKRTDYIGELIFENNELQFIQHEEGRIMVADHEGTGILPEYQYHLKDHLGNVRTTFTSRPKTTEFLATVENATAVEEAAEFDNYEDAKIVPHNLANHTPGGNKAIRLNATNQQIIGLAKSLKVYPGDKINMEVHAKFIQELPNANETNVGLLIGHSFLNAFGIVNSGETQEVYQFFSDFFSAGPVFVSDYGDGVPNAYLNYLLFDKDYNLMDAGFAPLTPNSIQPLSGASVPHDVLTLDADVTKEGYIYIYLSNENDMVNEVFFDDFKIEHIESPIIQADDYYPFGLSFNSYQRENSVANKYLYNGKELQDDLDLGWMDYGARMYQPELGRWHAIDPGAELYISLSPYSYVANNPLIFIDPTGAFIEKGSQEEWDKQTKAVKDRRENLANALKDLESIEAGGDFIEELKGQVSEAIDGLDGSIKTFGRLENSTQGYSLSTGVGEVGGATYDSNTGFVNIGFGNTSNFVHEVEHARQFEDGEIAFSKDGATYGQDLGDEVSAYRAQFHYDPSSVSGLKSTSTPYSLSTITKSWVQGITTSTGDKPYAVGGSSNSGETNININSGKADFIRAYPNNPALKGLPANFNLKSLPNIIYKK